MNLRIFLLLTLLLGKVDAQENWHLKKHESDIKIYTRFAQNSKIKEFKAESIINAPLNKVLNELLTAPDYFDDCPSGVSYLVDSPSKDTYIFYAKKELPWPVKDRDIVTQLTVKPISPFKVKLCLESVYEALPLSNNTIRVKKVMGHWLLQEDGERTFVTQELFVDPEGNLPPLIVNSLLVKGPFKTFIELHEAVEK